MQFTYYSLPTDGNARKTFAQFILLIYLLVQPCYNLNYTPTTKCGGGSDFFCLIGNGSDTPHIGNF